MDLSQFTGFGMFWSDLVRLGFEFLSFRVRFGALRSGPERRASLRLGWARDYEFLLGEARSGKAG